MVKISYSEVILIGSKH